MVTSLTFGFLVTVLATIPLMRWLSARQFGKAIRVDGPDHQAKSGTPTMGGMGMLLALLLFCVGGLYFISRMNLSQLADGLSTQRALPLWLVMLTMIAFAGFGLIDDVQGLARKSGRRELGVGLGARQMLLLQSLAGTVAGLVAARLAGTPSLLPESTPDWLTGLIFAFILVGTVNGVNMSDGLDGLAAGLIGIASAALGLSIYFGAGQFDRTDDAIFGAEGMWMPAFIIAGACLGFLIFNRHPAKVFMGNVTSMGLGAALAMLFIVSGYWWLLPIVGAVFVAEVLSVIIQVGYFKYSGGKRFFRMAPFHHHFELSGMHETQVVRRFWAAGLLAGLAGIALALVSLG